MHWLESTNYTLQIDSATERSKKPKEKAMTQIPISEEIRRDRERESMIALESLQKSGEDLLKEIFFHSQDALTQNPIMSTGRTIAYFSSLLVNLSRRTEESTKQTIKLTDETMKYTKRLHRLTVAIVLLTIVLLLQGFFEFPKVAIKFPQKINHTDKNANQNTQPYKPKANGEPILPAIKK